jgi:nitrate reductase gamma subunit
MRSPEFLEKKALFFDSVLFHWGILLALVGHAGGLLIPQSVFLGVILKDSNTTATHWLFALSMPFLEFD